jgi:hypothetical protein
VRAKAIKDWATEGRQRASSIRNLPNNVVSGFGRLAAIEANSRLPAGRNPWPKASEALGVFKELASGTEEERVLGYNSAIKLLSNPELMRTRYGNEAEDMVSVLQAITHEDVIADPIFGDPRLSPF